MSRALATAGYQVLLVNRHLDAAQAIADSLTQQGHSVRAYACDLSDLSATQHLHAALLAEYAGIDVLVHLVGGWRGSSTLDPSSVENWNALHPQVVDTLATLTGVFGETVRSSPRGRAFMVSSTSVGSPTAGSVAYVAAKTAAEAWMGGVADYFRDSSAASVILVVKALLTNEMRDADPDKAFPGFTHVDVLADAITALSTGPVENGARIDLTVGAA